VKESGGAGRLRRNPAESGIRAAPPKRVSIEERGISPRRGGGLRHYARSVIDTLAPRLSLYLRYSESLYRQIPFPDFNRKLPQRLNE